MIARQWESELSENDEETLPATRLPGQTSPIGHLLSQSLLDEAVRALQEDLAMLQAEQERGLGHLGGALAEIGRELGAVRTQLSALTEPLLSARAPATELEGEHADRDRERAELEQRFERIEKQLALLMRGMDSVDTLRHQSDVHTRALARLTDLITEVVKPRPVEGLLELQRAVVVLEASQQRSSRLQVIALAILGVGLTPGIGALGWLLLRGL